MMDRGHGKALIHREENLIVAKLIGSFNEEGAKKYTNAMKQAVKELQGANFLMLINDLEVEGGTPEALQELEDYNQWLSTQNLLAKAMVVKSRLIIDLINKYSPSQKLQHYEFFDNEKDAYAWLKTLSSKV